MTDLTFAQLLGLASSTRIADDDPRAWDIVTELFPTIDERRDARRMLARRELARPARREWYRRDDKNRAQRKQKQHN